MSSLRIGSRGSQLALWQANHIAGLLRARGHEVVIEVIKTTGDKITEVAFAQVGAKGMFTKEIEEALSAKHIDLAVHSLKDLPTDLHPEFTLAAILEREDPRDALLSSHANLQALPRNARVGTSSLRRQSQLRAARPDLRVEPVRGNIDTRMRKLEAAEFDAIVLAAAGVHRLGMSARIRELLSPQVMCPAPGQGALAIEVRTNDARTRQLVGFLDHHESREAVESERAMLRALGGGCQVPIGGYAHRDIQGLYLLARVGTPDGSLMLTEQGSGDDPEALGRTLAERLLLRGAEKILKAIYGSQAAAPQHA
jgi:hydroxymethylbilane synthase